ncbi:DNA repair protein RecN [Aliiglaciecola sp. CAU 1673]|uniref:DNA repair protein RecN n=1 Tax=Aliiglaciecola sp. CAU 1673 TaxID=3032595 RepID=UPI0023DA65D8|nr:DNA repair protein RecN [Aliiglaciecola sp. CAU 1673]MDF2178105.1 DNA repair protein RecN [Aliiglaciecola sp. CAU 1673]
MLLQLSVRQFAIVQALDIDFRGGMTAITGETGAGKSIAIDALGLCLGERAEASMVRSGADKAEITACFALGNLNGAQAWLREQELDGEDECIIRRVISAEGRSKAYINGVPVSLAQLKALGVHLIGIHGQHAHQQLLKADMQRKLLDDYAAHPQLLKQVSDIHKRLQASRQQYQSLLENQEQREARRQLLEYQVVELNDFAIEEGEFEILEAEHKRLSNSQSLLEQSQLSFHQLYEGDDFNALSIIQHALDRMSELQEHDPALSPIVELLNEASIQVEEASTQLRDYIEGLEIDPMRMQKVEQRYSRALELSRKHQVLPEGLYTHHQTLLSEFDDLQQDDNKLDELRAELNSLSLEYADTAKALSVSRLEAADRLSSEVETQIRLMNMSQAKFQFEVCFDEHLPQSKLGQDQIRILVSTNPGQPADTLEKVASGGELSRIGLALQVIASEHQKIPTMIFDEVDTGISGPTAAVVGQLLRRLGEKAQVLCVTHLPQVAACAHHQMLVTKFSDGNTTETHMMALEQEQRVEELARLLAGDKLTQKALDNAREMLSLD